MIGSEVKAIVKEPNENGDVHIETNIDNNISHEEILAAVGSIVTDCSKMTGIDVEVFVNIIRHMHYKGF